jgi:thiol-disulfide isomerase/thioredoxin
MNINLPVFFTAAMIFAGCKSNNIEINGKLENPKTGEYIYLEELKDNNLIRVDSVSVPDSGNFSFTRNIEFPSFYLLQINDTNFLTMLLEPGQKLELIAYSDSLNYPLYLSGSQGTGLMIEYNRKLRQTIKKLSGLRKIYLETLGKPELPLVMDSLDSTAQTYLNEINSYTKKYIDENLNSLVSLVALYQQVAPREYVLPREKNFKYYLKVDSAMFTLYPEYEPVITLHKEVQEMASAMNAQTKVSALPGEGSLAPEIILPDTQGDTIKLSSTRGKIVLLDFWAAWCTPCRQENPNLVKAYSLWHSKGFEIYQVSLDKTREAWLKGIQEDHLEKWVHVSDIKYWNSVVVPLYKIDSIPANLLLDKDGRIIASNLRGEMLQIKLAELFNKQ